MTTVRAFLDGVEIEKLQIPELDSLRGRDDWFDEFFRWALRNRPEARLDAIFVPESQELLLSEFWVGGAPAMRDLQVGGIMKTFVRT